MLLTILEGILQAKIVIIETVGHNQRLKSAKKKFKAPEKLIISMITRIKHQLVTQ